MTPAGLSARGRSAFGHSGGHAARHRGLLIEVITCADPVVAVSDPQRDPLDQQHGGQLLAGLDLLEVGGDFGVVRAQQRQAGGPQDVLGGIVPQRLLFPQGLGQPRCRNRPDQQSGTRSCTGGTGRTRRPGSPAFLARLSSVTRDAGLLPQSRPHCPGTGSTAMRSWRPGVAMAGRELHARHRVRRASAGARPRWRCRRRPAACACPPASPRCHGPMTAARGTRRGRGRASCCRPLAGLNSGRFGGVPVHRQAVTPAEPVDVPGKHILNPSQVLLVGGLDAQYQPARVGGDPALAPWVEPDAAAGFRPFGVDLHLAARGRVASGVHAGLVAASSCHRGCVPAELDEVPARTFGSDLCFGGQHGVPFLRSSCSAARRRRIYRDTMYLVNHNVYGRVEVFRQCHRV